MKFPKARASLPAYIFWYFQTILRVLLVDGAARIVRARRARKHPAHRSQRKS